MKHLIVLTLALFSLNAFAVKKGDTEEKARQELGKPIGEMTEGTRRILSYEKGDVIVENGKVVAVEFGAQDPTQPQVTVSAATAGSTPWSKRLNTNMLRLAGNSLAPDKKPANETKDYYAIYYSAHWCGPCRQFTPKLVSFYIKNSAQYKNWDLVFVSGDHSAEDMEKYVKENNMPWLVLDYSKIGQSQFLTAYAGAGIPCLVVVDKNGRVVLDSYEGQNYVGPTQVLSEFEKLLAKK
ncbi:MAG: thioredoxin-like domain-containing protein [Verrucomicrobiota bacterium]|nr:thioredoxin-like domain-containing protein [Verrucomicrobiota bacterium]